MEKLRFRLGLDRNENGKPIYRQGSFQELLVCHWCLSLWVASVLTIAVAVLPLSQWLLMALAASQAASMLIDAM